MKIKTLILISAIFILSYSAEARDISWKRFERYYPKYEKYIHEQSVKIYQRGSQINSERLFVALVSYESNWAKNASLGGCNGLCQIDGGPFEPHRNLRIGMKILARNLKVFKNDMKLALAAYNQGLYRVKHKIECHGFTGDCKFSNDILMVYEKLRIRENLLKYFKYKEIQQMEIEKKADKSVLDVFYVVFNCDECKIGEMVFTGNVKSIPVPTEENPRNTVATFAHKCSNCGAVDFFPMEYPHYLTRVIEPNNLLSMIEVASVKALQKYKKEEKPNAGI